MNKDLMKRTIAAHYLQVWSLFDAKNLLPGVEPTYWDAKRFNATTSIFESMNVLIPDSDYNYPPLESLTKSFNKWLALQKHDVRAVTSLYDMEQAVGLARMELRDVAYECEQLTDLPASLKVHVEAAWKRIDAEEEQLAQLRCKLSDVRDKLRKSSKRKTQVAA